MNLQARATDWHVRRFPQAGQEHVALKAAEEIGEVASAVIGTLGRNTATGAGDVPGEAADVVIALMVLLGRWYSPADLLEEVERKLSILTDPNSNHRSRAMPIILS